MESSFILDYTDNDVLLCSANCGRSIQAESHPGNEYFRKIVTKQSPKYKQCNKTARIRVAERVVETVLDNGGRFLIPADDDSEEVWIELDDKRSFDKVSEILGAPKRRKAAKKAAEKPRRKAVRRVVELFDSDDGDGNDSDSVVFVGSAMADAPPQKRSTRASRAPSRAKPNYAEESSNDDFEDEDEDEDDDELESASEEFQYPAAKGGADDMDGDDMLENPSQKVPSQVEVIDIAEEEEEGTPEVVPVSRTSGNDCKVNNLGYRKIDILTGRFGKKAHDHTGHARFQDLTLSYSRRPNMSSYVDEIIEKLQSNGARFMEWDGQSKWVEIEDEQVKRVKVKNSLANAHKRWPDQKEKSPSSKRSKEPTKEKTGKARKQKQNPAASLDPLDSLVRRVVDEVQSNGSLFKFLKDSSWVDAGNERTTSFVLESLERYQVNKAEQDCNDGVTNMIASLSDENKNEGQATGIGAGENSNETPKSLVRGTEGAKGLRNETSAPVDGPGAEDINQGITSDPQRGTAREPLVIDLLNSDEENSAPPVPSAVGRARTPRKAKTIANQHVQALQLADRLDKEEDLEEMERNDHVVAYKPSGVVGDSNGDTNATTSQEDGSKNARKMAYSDIDVLIGQGIEEVTKTHPGNIRFCKIIVKFQTEFRELKSSESLPTGRGKRKRTNVLHVADKRPRTAGLKLDPRLSEISFIQPPEDPNKQFYVEETAHRYHNPPFPDRIVPPEPKLSEEGIEVVAVSPNDLRPIPPPPPLPDFPSTGKCQWSFDEESRVLLADFAETPLDRRKKQLLMEKEDELFFLRMLERNDITVISEGLVGNLDPRQWNLNQVASILDFEFYHKFRRFDHKPTPSNGARHVEVDQCVAMTVGDYVKYLDHREKVLERGPRSQNLDEDQDVDEADNDALFTFKDDDGKEHTIDAGVSSIYMIDFDLGKYLPRMHSDFMTKMLYRGLLPGREHCMMTNVNSDFSSLIRCFWFPWFPVSLPLLHIL